MRHRMPGGGYDDGPGFGPSVKHWRTKPPIAAALKRRTVQRADAETVMGFASARARVDAGLVTRTARWRCAAVLLQAGSASEVFAAGATAAQRVDAFAVMRASFSAALVGPACRESRVNSSRLMESLMSASPSGTTVK